MTGQEWSEYLHQRVEEHHRARINKEIGEEDFPEIVKRFKKIKNWYNDEEKRERIITQILATDREGYKLVDGIIDLNNKIVEITGEEMVGGELTEEDIQYCPYLLEDLSQTIFRAKETIENKDKGPEKPEKKKEEKRQEKKRKLKTLEKEIKELESQDKELERKLADPTLSPTKKRSYEEDATEIRNQLLERRARLDSLQRELKNTDNDKSNLALGLGIFAAVTAVICLIILLARPSRRNQY